MKPLLFKFFFAISVILFFNNTAYAELQATLDEFCGKVKTCALETAGGEDQPPEIVAMMDKMFDGLCKSMLNPYYQTVGQAGLEDKAEACLGTVIDTSCETLMNSDGAYSTPACDDFKAAADEAGIDIGQ